jgi:hypothetical protein
MNIEPKIITTTTTQKSSLIFDKLNDAHSTSDNITDKILIVEIPESTPQVYIKSAAVNSGNTNISFGGSGLTTPSSAGVP